MSDDALLRTSLLRKLSLACLLVALCEAGLSLLSPGLGDDVWIAVLMAAASALLWIRKKAAWLAALIILFAAQGMNCALLFDGESAAGWVVAVRVASALVSLGAVAAILHFARYPYVDRRHGWFKMAAERMSVNVPAKVFEDGKEWRGTCVSLSETGCRIDLGRPWGHHERLEMIHVEFPGFGPTRIRSQVVGAEGTFLRLKFRDIAGDRDAFKQWVATYGSSDAGNPDYSV